MTVKKLVTVKFNSNLKISGANNDANYYIDWAAILKNDQQYYLSFTFKAQYNLIDETTIKIASVYINIFGENYMSNTTNYAGACTTLHLGVLQNSTNELYATTNNNAPIYLNSRPNNNNVNIQILNNDKLTDLVLTNLWVDSTPDIPGPPIVVQAKPPAEYILTLTFTEI